ncbi:hypothetical protein L1887_54022 [Cichorium endivia]|nr:hypothetical protein L1887_54022 [Cichorium endivia]
MWEERRSLCIDSNCSVAVGRRGYWVAEGEHFRGLVVRRSAASCRARTSFAVRVVEPALPLLGLAPLLLCAHMLLGFLNESQGYSVEAILSSHAFLGKRAHDFDRQRLQLVVVAHIDERRVLGFNHSHDSTTDTLAQCKDRRRGLMAMYTYVDFPARMALILIPVRQVVTVVSVAESHKYLTPGSRPSRFEGGIGAPSTSPTTANNTAKNANFIRIYDGWEDCVFACGVATTGRRDERLLICV